MKKYLDRAVFFLALTLLTLSLSLLSPAKVLASGEEEPTPTLTPTPTSEEVSEENPYGAAPYGQPVYGGGVITPREGEILIDKMVQNPATGTFVDQLSPTDPKYHPLDIVVFQLKVRNPGDERLDEIEITDSLPDYVDFMTGPGDYDSDTRKMTFTVNDLEGNETRNFEIKARVSHQAVFPEDQNVICPVNIVDAVVGDKSDHDESQFCIEKEMEVPEQVPSAGAEQTILLLLGSALTAGLALRKKAIRI